MIAFKILNFLSIRRKVESFRIKVIVYNPTDKFIWECFHNDITVVLVLKSVFKNIKLKYAYNANGAMTKDLNKGISSISYNLLNLPQQEQKNTRRMDGVQSFPICFRCGRKEIKTA